MRFAFIAKHRAIHPVNRLCQIVDVSEAAIVRGAVVP